LVLLIAAAVAHFYVKVGLTWVNVMVFIVPFVWSMEERHKGRKKRIVEAEKEIAKMKAKDI